MSWAIKESFLTYLAGLGDGTCTVTAPASRHGNTFVFPIDTDDPAHFQGTVTFTGHHGHLHVAIGDPSTVTDGARGRLTIADPDWPGRRMTLAHFDVDAPAEAATGTWRATNVALTADGSDLFFRVYDEGAALADFAVHGQPDPVRAARS
jgi:hypothetical protein